MFIRIKKRAGQPFYYLVSSERAGQRVRQRIVAYLGEHSTVAEAVESLRCSLDEFEEAAKQCREKAEAARSKLPAHYMNSVVLQRAQLRDGVPTFLYRGSRLSDDPAKQFHRHMKDVRYCERWAAYCRARLDKLLPFVGQCSA
jgi:hypothetical protein